MYALSSYKKHKPASALSSSESHDQFNPLSISFRGTPHKLINSSPRFAQRQAFLNAEPLRRSKGVARAHQRSDPVGLAHALGTSPSRIVT